ncbi:MAG: replication-associated recombination protein A [Clostridiales bacterium]|nr:replication-associated recombination protein A [Clostridiales bacterium]
MNLFDLMNKDIAPLAERMRPTTLDEFAGQEHIVGQNSLLRRAILTDSLGSCIFYGAPGCGKTTLANIIANTTKSNFVKLNAVSSGISDAKKVIEDAKSDKDRYGITTYLLLDECHRWNKAQSDCMLEAIEKGHIVFIGSTTENPFVSMTRAIVSRCRIFEFKPLSDSDIKKVLMRAISDKSKGLGNMNLSVSEEAINHFVWASDGDLRNALNALELAAKSTNPDENGIINVDVTVAEQSSQKKSMSIDESMYYDMLSAFCKSWRGSDSDAALYWAERLIQAGCDPMLILRRLIVHSSEDVGMADPQALVVATSALTAYQNIGLPEGKIPLYNAIIYVCEAPKSNSVVMAKCAVEEVVANKKDDKVPMYLMDKNYKTQKISGYKYPHNYGGWVEQQYLPDSLKDERFYNPSTNGFEKYLIRAKDIKANKQENKKN